MSIEATPSSHAGQAVYSPLTLLAYDLLVLGLSNPLIWRCPTARIQGLYDENVSVDHLDVGVGTGRYLDRCRWPSSRPGVTLLDLNPHCLETAGKRIARYQPRRLEGDVMRPLPFAAGPFGSIGMSYLLHCLSGDLHRKACVFDNLMPLLADDGVVFGATLLSAGVRSSIAARALMGFYNRKGIFSNAADRLDDLELALTARFERVEIEVAGCVALFTARSKKTR